MILPSFRRIFTQDYEAQYKKLIDTLSVSLNNGITSLYSALTNNVSLSDNIYATVKTLSLKVDANGNPLNTTSFNLNSYMTSNQIQGISVINAINQDNSNTYPVSGPFISYTQNGTTVTVNNITGLQQGANYNITVVAWG